MLLATLPVGPLAVNCSIVADKATRKAFVIDPGGSFERIRERLEQESLALVTILLTHTHIDHVGAVAALQDWSGAEVRLHAADQFLYDTLGVQAAMLGMPAPTPATLGEPLVDGETLHAGDTSLQVLHTPGHTPGGVTFLWQGTEGGVAFCGDTMFRESVGRTDLWGGDHEQLIRSIRERLLVLDDATRVVPGHGPNTTIGHERRFNPFLR